MLPCAVLDDGTRILYERGISNVLSSKGSGAYWKRKRESSSAALLPSFISPKNLAPFIPDTLLQPLLQPRVYLERTGNRTRYGFEATILPQICDAWLNARSADVLLPSQENAAARAERLR